ncbi:MAG TPA: hypothetical protein VLY23_03660 [Candidatus Acidoferrum sp.]|nr:hypothetical protein [Candidatus Acidoferrum sp.]
MQPRRKLLSLAVVPIVFAGIAIPVLAAFTYPLSSEAIREAYFLGNRNDEQTADFLAKYAHQLPMPKTGPYVDEIGVDTPFTQIVRHAKITPSYNAPDAVQEFQGKFLPMRVHVDIALTPSYSPVSPSTDSELYQWVPDFWNDFTVHVSQNDKEIPAMNRRGGPVYAYADDNIPYITGARIELEFDSEKIDSVPFNVEVLTPDHRKVETAFNLSRLR